VSLPERQSILDMTKFVGEESAAPVGRSVRLASEQSIPNFACVFGRAC
jgi:hypothetical protein